MPSDIDCPSQPIKKPIRTSDRFDLDLTPSGRQLAVLRRLDEGDRVLVARGGRGYAWERTDASVDATTGRRLVDNQWLVRPDYPLFGSSSSGRLTERGRAAFARSRE
jgi:hypothetical protein